VAPAARDAADRDVDQARADRLGERDVGHQAVAEEGVDAVAGAVEELVGDDDVGRLVVDLQRADGGDRDQLLDSQRLEAVDVGAVVELGRRQPVAASVARQEGDRAPVQLADDVGVRRLAERRRDPPLLAHHQPLHLVEAAAADHTDTNIAHGETLLSKGKPDPRREPRSIAAGQTPAGAGLSGRNPAGESTSRGRYRTA
jgi:hypothetical protein